MKKILKLGFIGGAQSSAVGYAHFAACRMDNRWDVQAGCFSTDTQRSIESGKTYGITSDRVYETWEELLSKEHDRLDAIAVLLPTPNHFEVVKECLSAGYPVICEKALATNYKEAEELLSLVNKINGFLAVTYNYPGYPMVRELRHLIQSGRLGKILHFQAEMPQEGFIRQTGNDEKPAVQEWRLSDGKIPAIYLDLGSHLHHLVYYLTGEKPLQVTAQHSSYGAFAGIIDDVSCLCKYTNSVNGKIWFSKSAPGYRNGLCIRIFGSLGSAQWVQTSPEEIYLSFIDGSKQIIDRSNSVNIAGQQRYNRFKAGHPSGFIEAFANLYYDIADSLLLYQEGKNYASDEVSGADVAREGLKFLKAIAVSAVSEKWVQVKNV